MDERPTGRFRNRSDHELHATALGRRMWRSIRAVSRAIERDEPRQQAPYETSYRVAHGYQAERPIVLPEQ